MFDNEKNTMISVGVIMSLILAVVIGHGYSNKINDVTMTNSKRVIAKYEKLEDKLISSKNELKSSELYKQTKNIYKAKNLDGSYDTILTKITSFKPTVTKLKTLIDEDTMWSQDDTYALSRLINTRVSTFNKNIGQPKLDLVTTKREIDGLIKLGGSAKTLLIIENKYDIFSDKVKSQKKKHPKKVKDINNLTAKYTTNLKNLKSYSKIIMTNLDKKYDMNYSQFKKINNMFNLLSKKVINEMTVDTETIMSLNKSYSKMLTDMKATFAISFGWSTWDDYAEWDNTRTGATGYKQVPESDYYKIIEANDLVAKCTRGGFFSNGGCKTFSPNVGKYINKSVPSGNTTIEYWVRSTDAKFYHKYTIETDGKSTETKWVSVSEQFYWDNHKNLGMALESKPMGSFTSETLKQATPPGMAYVGNSNYGSYNSSGSWMFFPMFMGNYGSYGYDRNDYSNYNNYRSNRNSRTTSGYYGRNNSFGTYGKRTYSKGSRFVKPTNTYRKSTTSRTGTRSTARSGAMGKSSRTFGSNSRGRGAGGGGK
jgi:hypothetical protein